MRSAHLASAPARSRPRMVPRLRGGWAIALLVSAVWPTIGALQSGGVPAFPGEALPSVGCWFWTEGEFHPRGYEPFLDLVGPHSPFKLLTTSLRVPQREVAEPQVHDQIARAAAHAERYGVRLVMDLDVRLARQAFRQTYPDELQEMLRLREVPLSATEEVALTVKSDLLGDHYTFATTPYVPTAGRLERVYAYDLADGAVDSASVVEITGQCRVVRATTNDVQVIIPAGLEPRRTHAVAAVVFTHFTPDVFAPHLRSFQRQLLGQYADVPLAGACKDEWGFPPCFDGCPAKNDFWYSRPYAAAYRKATGGRDLVRDALLMWRGERGRDVEREAAINHYQRLAWQQNAALETDFYHAVKGTFGSTAMVATHPTWWPNPDLREFKKNGLHWWAAKRDLAQTDEITPFAVRTALAKKWGSAVWLNMFYASSVSDYERSVWSHALGGGRLNYHPLYPSTNGLALDNTRALLRGDLMEAEGRVRLLNFISQAPLDCPVAVIFGHACAMNWAGPHYNDVGLDLANALWQQGYPADLIPAEEFLNGSLRPDGDGWLRYGSQRYRAAILYHFEYEPARTERIMRRVAKGRTQLWRVGEWRHDFVGRAVDVRWPANVRLASGSNDCALDVVAWLEGHGIAVQTPATGWIGWDTRSPEPPRAGTCRLGDGTIIHLAGAARLSGDPVHLRQAVGSHQIELDAVGVAAVRLDRSGRLEGLAAGGLRRVRGGGLDLNLDPPLDLALWRVKSGPWQGAVRSGRSPVPETLLRLTPHWQHLPPSVGLPE